MLLLAARLVRARRQHSAATGVRLDELLLTLSSCAGSMMHDREAVTAYVPLVGLRVAEPPLKAQVVPLLYTLPAELSGLYASPARLFKDEEESQAIFKSRSR